MKKKVWLHRPKSLPIAGCGSVEGVTWRPGVVEQAKNNEKQTNKRSLRVNFGTWRSGIIILSICVIFSRVFCCSCGCCGYIYLLVFLFFVLYKEYLDSFQVHGIHHSALKKLHGCVVPLQETLQFEIGLFPVKNTQPKVLLKLDTELTWEKIII